MKSLEWIGSSLTDLQAFPELARRAAGYQLHLVQQGEEPGDWKPMPLIGAGAAEIRVQVGGAWRVAYVAKFIEAVYVLHCFGKKTQRTGKADLELAAARYRRLVEERGKKAR